MVEQTGFLERDRLAAAGHPFASYEQGLTDSFDISPKQRLQDPVSKQSVKMSIGAPSARDALSESMRTVLENGPIERTALMFGIPVSQASSMLGVGGVILLILGLWMIRAVVRTEKP